jgi:peptide/nickel transport system permease protein
MLIPMLMLLSAALFLAMELIPVDPLLYLVDLETYTSPNINIENLRESLGLNDPLPLKYIKWLIRTLQGDWGYSILSGASISKMVLNRLPATLELSAAALLISTLLGLTAGFISAIKQNTPIDYLNTATGLIATSVPDFFFGISMILVFGVKRQWLPTGNRFTYGANSILDRFSHLLMPALVLGLVYTAALMRTTRASMLDVLNADYIKTARSKGLSKSKVYIKHGLRNALIPIMLLLCFRLPMLIGGAVIIETVFNWTGMGQMILMGVGSKDYPIVMATVLATATVLLLASLLVDILTAALDPRVRIGT